MQEFTGLPSAGTMSLLVLVGGVIGALLKFKLGDKKQDQGYDLSVGKAFGERMEKLEIAWEKCMADHQQCNARVRVLELAEEARRQNDVLYQQILGAVREIGAEAITGRRAALDEIKAQLDLLKPQAPPAPA